MTETRLIKKYPNRRLYDTAISSYITLEDVKRLVMDKVPLKVIEARTQSDITHSTLLQIIFEQEETGPPLFSTDLLQEMIRFYGDSMHKVFGKMFEQGMKYFSEQRKNWQSDLMGEDRQKDHSDDPVKFMAQFTHNNVNQWQQFQEMWLQNFQGWAASSRNLKESDVVPVELTTEQVGQSD
tara:strand:- start:12335 stop:12877 length:543 start_codon:yes stop_codon:yes gene_type:complete